MATAKRAAGFDWTLNSAGRCHSPICQWDCFGGGFIHYIVFAIFFLRQSCLVQSTLGRFSCQTPASSTTEKVCLCPYFVMPMQSDPPTALVFIGESKHEYYIICLPNGTKEGASGDCHLLQRLAVAREKMLRYISTSHVSTQTEHSSSTFFHDQAPPRGRPKIQK
jgi:hypothetical protein